MAERALASAYVTIIPSFDGFRKSIDRDLPARMGGAGEMSGKAFGSKFTSGFRSLVGPALAAFSVASATKFLGDSVQLASDLSEQGAAVGQVFGKSAGEVTKFAAGAATTLGQSTVQILEAAKSFGIYGKAAGLAGSKNAKFSTDFVKLATDLASFNNTSVDEALLALQSGLRGEAEPLRRFGVLLDDATLRQEALKLGLVKTTKDALTPQQKVLAAQAAIYAQTATQQGDFARTSDGLANQQRILTAEFENVKSKIGEQLIPIFKDLVGWLSREVIPKVEKFIQDFKDGKTPLNDVFTIIKNFVTFIRDNKDWLAPIIVSVTTFIGLMKLWTAWTNLCAIANFLLDAALTANPVGLVVIAIAALVAGLIWFFTQTKTGQAVFQKMVDAWRMAFWLMKKIVETFANITIGIINTIIDAINILLTGIKYITFGAIDLKIPKIPMLNIAGDMPTSGSTATPAAVSLTKQQQQTTDAMHAVTGTTFIYNAAPNNSLDAKTELVDAVKKARDKGVGN